jgi:5-methyltetrahydrofolate--homocysteine methyltransferase
MPPLSALSADLSPRSGWDCWEAAAVRRRPIFRALAHNIKDISPIPPWRKSLSAVSSARGFKVFDRQDPLVVIGERINPTGKRALQQELAEGKTAIIRQMAKEQQQEQGADMLDVNVGVPGIDESRAIRDVIRVLIGTTPLPLALDSPKIETLDAAIAVSIRPGPDQLHFRGTGEALDPSAPSRQIWGHVHSPSLEDGHNPRTAQGRRAVIRKVYQVARGYGYTKEDMIIDGLVMTVASNPAAARETINTVAWCTDTFKCRTILGISNVSFGLPERRWINAAFLNMAQGAGLTMAIANPATAELMNAKKAADVLLEKDRGAPVYCGVFRHDQAGDGSCISARTPEEKASRRGPRGKPRRDRSLIDGLLQKDQDPARIIDRS